MTNSEQRDIEAEARLRSSYRATILRVLIRTAGEPAIAINLAIGEACRAATARQRSIWLEEVADCELLKASIETALESGDLADRLTQFIGEPEGDN
jgi:hypothetical protein